MAWWITFTILIFIVLSLGFGPAGVIGGESFAHKKNTASLLSSLKPPLSAPFSRTTLSHSPIQKAPGPHLGSLSVYDFTGSMAAAFQAFCYGGLTPAGGIFATLTSVAMLGWMNLLVTLIAMVVATAVAGVVWLCGAGR